MVPSEFQYITEGVTRVVFGNYLHYYRLHHRVKVPFYYLSSTHPTDDTTAKNSCHNVGYISGHGMLRCTDLLDTVHGPEVLPHQKHNSTSFSVCYR